MTTATTPPARLRLNGCEAHDAPPVPYGTEGYDRLPWLPAGGLVGLVDAVAQSRSGLVIVGCDHYGLSVELDGHRFQISSGTVAHQTVAVAAYGDLGGLWVWRLTRVEWGGGIAGGNINATKDACVAWDARAVVQRFIATMRRLAANA